MERDPQLSKLIRENGVVPAPEGFTASVMDRLAAEPEKRAYRPIIGKSGRIMIILFVVAVVVLSPRGLIIELVPITIEMYMRTKWMQVAMRK